MCRGILKYRVRSASGLHPRISRPWAGGPGQQNSEAQGACMELAAPKGADKAPGHLPKTGWVQIGGQEQITEEIRGSEVSCRVGGRVFK